MIPWRRVIGIGGRDGKPRDDRQKDLLRPALDQIIDLGHPLVRLAARSTGGFSMTALVRCARPVRGSRPADATGRRPVHPEAHAQSLGRGAVRALAGEPLLPVLLRRVELLPPAAVRSLIDDALAPAAGRGAARRAAPGKPVGGAQDRRHRPPRTSSEWRSTPRCSQRRSRIRPTRG